MWIWLGEEVSVTDETKCILFCFFSNFRLFSFILFSHFLSQNATGVCRREQRTQTERQTNEMCRKAGYCPTSRGSTHCSKWRTTLHWATNYSTGQASAGPHTAASAGATLHNALKAHAVANIVKHMIQTHTCSALRSKYIFQCVAVIFDIS